MKEILDSLRQTDNYRTLRSVCQKQKYTIYQNKQYLNLSSNDYLSMADPAIQSKFFNTIDLHESFLMSNPSSRLMTGNSFHYDSLEQSLCDLYQGRSALVLGSGFLLNSGILSAITTPKDLILADKLVHASLIDGIRLCGCHWERYRHNDMEHLEALLKRKRAQYNRVFIVTESIFSMDGDLAPLQEIIALKEQYDAMLYLDEAHAFGVRGTRGGGVAQEQGVDQKIDLLVGTFGKAGCSQGAYVICETIIREMLINKMRTLIFSTALPPISLLWSKFVIDYLSSNEGLLRRNLLSNNIQIFRQQFACCNKIESHIIPILVGDNAKTLALATNLREQGYWTTAIRHPTVAAGSARLRVSLCSAITPQEIVDFTNILKNCLQ